MLRRAPGQSLALGRRGASGTMGTPSPASQVLLPDIVHLAPSAETVAGRGDDQRDPSGPHTDPGRQSSPSRPRASPGLPSLTPPLELPGRVFFPYIKKKDDVLVFLSPGHSGLNYFINHGAAPELAGARQAARGR